MRDRMAVADAIGHRTTVALFSYCCTHECKLVLQFAAPAGPSVRRRRAMQVQAVSLICSANRASIEAHMMHAVIIRSRTTATAAVSKDSSSFFTEHMLVCHALVEVLVDHRQSRK